MTNAFGSGRYDDLSERAFGKRIIDGQGFAAILIFSRCHSFDADEKIVQSSRAGKSCFKGRIEQGGAFILQHGFGISDAEVLQEFLWAYAGPVGEETLKMKRAQMYFLRYFIQVRLLFKMCPDIIYRRGDPVIISCVFHDRMFL